MIKYKKDKTFNIDSFFIFIHSQLFILKYMDMLLSYPALGIHILEHFPVELKSHNIGH